MAWRDDVVLALEEVGGVAHLDEIYQSVEAVRRNSGVPLPVSWRAIVRRELEYNSSDSESYQQRHDLFYSVHGLGRGIWGLRSMLAPTPVAEDLSDPNTTKLEITTYRILRDTQLARQLKKLHNDTCQLCRRQLRLSPTTTYSEAHHIRPLGSPHNGPDVPGNILVVCPSCHALCDFAAIELSKHEIFVVEGHELDQKFLEYHNARYAARWERDGSVSARREPD